VAGAGTVQPLVLTAFVTTWSVTVTASPGKDSRAKPSSNRLKRRGVSILASVALAAYADVPWASA